MERVEPADSRDVPAPPTFNREFETHKTEEVTASSGETMPEETLPVTNVATEKAQIPVAIISASEPAPQELHPTRECKQN